jgi:hypothetical protein
MMYNGLLMISGRDYYKTESKVSESYKNHALIQLQNTFPDTPLGYIRYSFYFHSFKIQLQMSPNHDSQLYGMTDCMTTL